MTYQPGSAIGYKKLTPAKRKKHRELVLECIALKERLFRHELYKTGHKMDEVTKQIGWEIAELEELQAGD